MDAGTRAHLTQALRRQRATLLEQFAHGEASLRSIGEDRAPELEERAQEERAARVLVGLDDRRLHEIADIHAALQRIIDGTYGRCLGCERPIPLTRLHALPTVAFCLACAREEESSPSEAPATEPAHPGKLPADLDLLLDREVEEALRQLVREDRRLDLDELRLVCRHGVVHLDGAVPSEVEHQMLRKLVTDVAGCEEVVDHVRVNELLWERAERSRTAPPSRTRPARFEPVGTEDVVESTEEGLDWMAPDRPPPDEE
jgi:RNA polymerase-binding protein DksA